MATTLLFSDAVTNTYKNTSQAVNEVNLSDKKIIKKALVEIIQQSFFHGASRFGTNFIA